ncbi:MAG: peptide/nickel transport system permease protein, partial [Gaiellales bacterium]|nr:peptide/nickel transport system permease protein [Gaiellales bacterium]
MLLYQLNFKYRTFPLFSWIPGFGYVPFTQDPLEWAKHLVLPWITLAVVSIGFYARVVRSSLLETRHLDYVRTARAKGLSSWRVLTQH